MGGLLSSMRYSWWSLAAAWQPAEPADGDDQSCCAPGGEDGEVAPAQPGPRCLRVVGGQQGGGEGLDREDLANVGEPGGQLRGGNENAGDEAERQDDGLDDGLGGVNTADNAGHGEAQAAEGGRADDDVQGKGWRGAARVLLEHPVKLDKTDLTDD